MYVAIIKTESGDLYAATYGDTEPTPEQAVKDFADYQGQGELQTWIDDYGVTEGTAAFYDCTCATIVEADEH